MSSPTFLSDGHTPRRDDTKWAIEQKILGALVDGGGGGGAPAGAGFNLSGHGAPTLSPHAMNAAYDNSLTWIYADEDDNNRLYTWTGTAWG